MMAAIAALVVATIVLGSYYLNKPAYETLYVGLERSDVNQIGLVLGEAGIGFDVASDGTTVLVPAGTTAQARMLLAEKGLPTSANAGYELFDNVGSLGLTSFMQQVTRVRALEGEIARTIQSIQGIKAARVHIVMAERANFRRDEQEPTASVVIRASDIDAAKSAMSIRYLVAAAVPGLNVDKVTVLDSSGTLLAAGDDPNNTSASRSLGVERTVETEIEDNIRRALTPYLGPDNFRASVKAEVNTDTRQTEETIYDPESRVERSVQVVRANENNNQKTSAAPASVDQNLPEAESAPTAVSRNVVAKRPQGGDDQLRDELQAHRHDQQRLLADQDVDLGRRQPAAASRRSSARTRRRNRSAPASPRSRRWSLRRPASASSAATSSTSRRSSSSTASTASRSTCRASSIRSSAQAGTMINALAFVVVAFLVAWFGLRPMAAAMVKPAVPALPAPSFEDVQRSLPTPDPAVTATSADRSRADGRSERPAERQRARRSAPEDQAGAAGTAGPHGRPQ